MFNDKTALSPDEWAKASSRIPFREDLPITLQGGEPMIYWQGAGVGLILEKLPHYFDLLTSFALLPNKFIESLRGQEKKLKRAATFPSDYVITH